MKLSTRCRYGTRLMLDLAQHYGEGPVQIGDIAKRQAISVKYLEQILIPLKKAGFVVSVRGSRGGHLLGCAPEKITVGAIVVLLDGGLSFVECVDHPEACDRSQDCLTRQVWSEALEAMYEKLESTTLWDLVQRGKSCGV